MPGSPPTRTTEPGTTPPPNTLSNSTNPVRIRSSPSTSIESIGTGWEILLGGVVCRLLEEPPISRSSFRVFHCPQSGHRPNHLGA